MEGKKASQLHTLDVAWQPLSCFRHLLFKDKDDKDKASNFPRKKKKIDLQIRE